MRMCYIHISNSNQQILKDIHEDAHLKNLLECFNILRNSFKIDVIILASVVNTGIGVLSKRYTTGTGRRETAWSPPVSFWEARHVGSKLDGGKYNQIH